MQKYSKQNRYYLVFGGYAPKETLLEVANALVQVSAALGR